MNRAEEESYRKYFSDNFKDLNNFEKEYLGDLSTYTHTETSFTPEKMKEIIDTLEKMKEETGGLLLGICVTDRYAFGSKDSFSKVPLFEDDKNSDFYLFCTWGYWSSVLINKNLMGLTVDESPTYSWSRLSGVPVYDSDTYIQRVILKDIYSNRFSVLDYMDKLGYDYWK